MTLNIKGRVRSAISAVICVRVIGAPASGLIFEKCKTFGLGPSSLHWYLQRSDISRSTHPPVLCRQREPDKSPTGAPADDATINITIHEA